MRQHQPESYLRLASDAALERLKRAKASGERIRVVTDYDVDGTTSSLILQAALALTAPECDLDYHIPNRFGEGYGFSVQAAEAAADDGVSLIVTADIGVRDHEAASAARARGVDVLICDHHLPAGAEVPSDAIVLCPPQRECTYGNPHLAACGVSFKLAQETSVRHTGCKTLLAISQMTALLPEGSASVVPASLVLVLVSLLSSSVFMSSFESSLVSFSTVSTFSVVAVL